MSWKSQLYRLFGRCSEAAAEVCVVIVLGFVPFFISAARFNYEKKEKFDLSSVFIESFSGGQLYLYAFSLFGTLMWLSLFNWQIPYTKGRIAIGFFLVLLGLLISGLGGIDPTFSKIINYDIVSWGYWIYALFVVFYFALIILSKQQPPTVSATLNLETDELLQKFGAVTGKAQ